ncbi:MAG: Rnf-Nqr domain containing protein, partial [Spirochaetota bacterium]|nr:Rnf-Nqr domain containing protein [Spirochaetota bacterium]
FILVIASLVQLVEMFLKKSLPPLYSSLGIFLPLITTNCAVLGVALLNIRKEFDFVSMLLFSFASAIGFALALILFAGMRERFEIADIPKPLAGTGIGLVTAGMMALAFFGFVGVDAALKAL